MGADFDNGTDIAVKVAGQEVNVKNVKSLNTILTMLSLVVIVAMGVLLFTHVEAESKGVNAIKEGNAALLKEVKDANAANIQSQKNIAFYICRSSCLLEQPTERRNPTSCDAICAPMKQ